MSRLGFLKRVISEIGEEYSPRRDVLEEIAEASRKSTPTEEGLSIVDLEDLFEEEDEFLKLLNTKIKKENKPKEYPEIDLEDVDFKLNEKQIQAIKSGDVGYPEDLKGTMAVMHPLEYLSLTLPKEDFDKISKHIRDWDVDKLQNLISKVQDKKVYEESSDAITPMFLRTDNEGQVLGHEGRHRALSTLLSGGDKYPVYLGKKSRFRDFDKLKGQFDPDMKVDVTSKRRKTPK